MVTGIWRLGCMKDASAALLMPQQVVLTSSFSSTAEAAGAVMKMSFQLAVKHPAGDC